MNPRSGIATSCCLLLLATAATASGSPAQTTYHIGDIALTGSQVYEIRGETLRQKGNILVGDNATLRIVDAGLEFLKSDVDSEVPRFTVSGRGRLILQNSRLNLTNCYYILITDEAEVILNGSEVIHYDPYRSNGYSIVWGFALDGNASLHAVDSRIGEVELQDRSSARATGTFIGNLYDEERAAFRLDNCTLEDLYFRMVNSTGSVKLRLGGHVQHWYSKTNATGLPFEAELSNTTLLKGATLLMTNSSVRFVDSDFYQVSLWIGGLTAENSRIGGVYVDAGRVFEVKNSTIDIIEVWNSELPRLNLFGSRIGTLSFQTQITSYMDIRGCEIGDADLSYYSPDGSTGVCWLRDTRFGNLTLLFESPLEAHAVNVTVGERFGVLNAYYASGLEVSGDIVFDLGCVYEEPWLDIRISRVTRAYDLKVTGGSNPVSGARIEARRGNITIWSGETDTGGYAHLNRVFVDRFQLVENPKPGGPYTTTEFNMTSPVTLVVSYGGDVVERDVGLLSTTPLYVAFPAYTRGQRGAIAAFFFAALLLLVAWSSGLYKLAHAPRRS
jgi:hypothetical protein